MAYNYDNAAWFYDSLSQLVFGRAIVNAQVYLLQFIPAQSNILIVGGGTGWILDELTKLQPSGLNITYVEVSVKMMELSSKRNLGGNQVTFINTSVEEVVLLSDFDVVITPFLFDNFSQQTAKNVFSHLNFALKYSGLWLYADFEPTGKLWQKILLKTMHIFFRILCSVATDRLPDVQQLFHDQLYTPTHSKQFFGHFIKAAVYRRGR